MQYNQTDTWFPRSVTLSHSFWLRSFRSTFGRIIAFFTFALNTSPWLSRLARLPIESSSLNHWRSGLPVIEYKMSSQTFATIDNGRAYTTKTLLPNTVTLSTIAIGEISADTNMRELFSLCDCRTDLIIVPDKGWKKTIVRSAAPLPVDATTQGLTLYTAPVHIKTATDSRHLNVTLTFLLQPSKKIVKMQVTALFTWLVTSASVQWRVRRSKLKSFRDTWSRLHKIGPREDQVRERESVNR